MNNDQLSVLAQIFEDQFEEAFETAHEAYAQAVAEYGPSNYGVAMAVAAADKAMIEHLKGHVRTALTFES